MHSFHAAAVCLSIVQASGFASTAQYHRPHPQRPGSHALGATGVLEEPSRADPLVALEFYSGIGGLRVSLEKALEAVSLQTSVGSFEISSVANSVYEHNFPGCSVTRRSIEHLSAQDIEVDADIWLLSPPCQPFCRVGNKMDEQDNRSVSFLHLLSLLKTIRTPPSFLFLENVQGFEGSHAHLRLLETLTARGFDVEQYLLSPNQLGIPNSRLRYYCLARRRNADGMGKATDVKKSFPQDVTAVPLRPLSKYLDPSLYGEAAVPLLLSPKACSHANPSLRFDVVTLQSTETTTFTKGYRKHAGRAGPVVLLTDDGERRVSGEKLGRFPSGLDLGPEGKEVRWFSDREMLRLHGFPEAFDFPTALTPRQRCALVGNSVNVEVVALLLEFMLFEGNARGDWGERFRAEQQQVSTV
ncbi:unnamed protein product [Ectocarpus sp. 6 AP-2014]